MKRFRMILATLIVLGLVFGGYAVTKLGPGFAPAPTLAPEGAGKPP
jgi:hypothetical protein